MLRFGLIWVVFLSGCRSREVVVWIAADGALTVNGRPAPREELGTLLSVKAASSACVIADSASPYARAIEAMDVLSKAGVKDLQLAIAPGPCPPR